MTEAIPDSGVRATVAGPPAGSEQRQIGAPVLRDQKIRSWPKFPNGGSAEYTTLPVALTREYVTDAHVGAYAAPSLPRRLGTEALLKPEAREVLPDGVAMVLAVFDVDCPDAHRGDPHAADAWWLDETEKITALLAAHPAGFVYRTRGGYRLVYRLPGPVVLRNGIDAEGWSIRYCGWIAYLERSFEIRADAACKDWTRLYRLPHATRDLGGRPERRETRGDTGSIGCWEPTLDAADVAQAARLHRKRTPKSPPRRGTAPLPVSGDGVLAALMRTRGWLGDLVEPGKWTAVCPWADQHTKGAAMDGSTVLFAPPCGEVMGWLHCSHAHCGQRTIADVLGLFTDAEIAAARASVTVTTVQTTPEGVGATSSAQAATTAAQVSFLRGDHVEIAEVLLPLLDPDPKSVVHDEGCLYRYDAMSGLWRVLEKPHLRTLASRFAGRPCGDKVLKMKVSDADGAIAFACARASTPQFFQQGPAGLAFTDGFVQVTDAGEIRRLPHSREHRARSSLDFAYATAGECPLWLAFLSDTFSGDIDAAEKCAFLQEVLGAALLGIMPGFDRDVVLLGDGANGKSVVIEVFQGAMPPGTVCAIPPQDWGSEYRLAMLAGKLLNVVTELPESDILASGVFKSVVSGETLTGRHIREAPFGFNPRATHVFAANMLPSTGDQSHGFWRRPVIVKFNNVVPEARQNERLSQDLLDAERPAIIRWGLEGAARLKKRSRLTIPPSSKAEIEKWRQRTDVVRAFLLEETAQPRDVSEWLPAQHVYDHYRNWCTQNGHRLPLASNSFGERMRLNGRASIHRRAGNFYPVRLRDRWESHDQTNGGEESEVDQGEGREGGEGGPESSPCARVRTREGVSEEKSFMSFTPHAIDDQTRTSV